LIVRLRKELQPQMRDLPSNCCHRPSSTSSLLLKKTPSSIHVCAETRRVSLSTQPMETTNRFGLESNNLRSIWSGSPDPS
jgi:hypothetical protein